MIVYGCIYSNVSEQKDKEKDAVTYDIGAHTYIHANTHAHACI
mgnify:CR=1 FL=1